MTSAVFSICGISSPLAAPEILYVSFLRREGYLLVDSRSNYQQIIKPDGTREWIFLFVANQPDRPPISDTVKNIKSGDHWVSPVFSEYRGGNRPLAALADLADLVDSTRADDFAELVEFHRALLNEIASAPVHIELKNGNQKWYFPADTPPDAISEIMRGM